MSKKSRDLRIWLFQYQKARERDHNFYIRVSESLLPKIPLIKVGNRNLAKIKDTVFPRIVSAETILFWKLECGNYSREETIQGRKLLIIRRFKGGQKLEYWS